MKLIVHKNGEQVPIFGSTAKTRWQLVELIGCYDTGRFRMGGDRYHVNDVQAIPDRSALVPAVIIFAILGLIGGPIGVLIGGGIGMAIGYSQDEQDRRRVATFNSSFYQSKNQSYEVRNPKF